ncbi:MAG TPA: VanZ family protein [Pyrinomonadaceae bacterium]|nr:VanZ family protein [Pyrinomonadaceae bacterium]
MTARIKILTVVYVCVLAVLIFLADKRATQYLFKPIRNLPYGDKIGHFLLMGFFSFLLNLALSARSVKLWKFHYLLGSLIVLVVVTIEEVSQIFIRGRTFDWGDLAADFCGIFIFGEIARFLCNRKSKANFQEPT